MTIDVRQTFRQVIQNLIDEGLGATNDIIVERVDKAVSDEELRDAFRQVLYWNCAGFVGEHRRAVDQAASPATSATQSPSAPAEEKPMPKPSARLSNMRRHSERCRRILGELLNVAPGVYKPRGECSPDEVLYSVRTRQAQAQGLLRTAADDERRATRALELGVATIGDLDDDDIAFDGP